MTTLPQLCPSRQASARWDCRDWAGHRASQRLRPAGNEGNGKSQRSGGVAEMGCSPVVHVDFPRLFHRDVCKGYGKRWHLTLATATYWCCGENPEPSTSAFSWTDRSFSTAPNYSPVNCGSSYVRSHQSRTTSHETGWCWQMTCKGHTTWNCLGRFVGLSWSTSQVVVFHVGVLRQVEIPDQANSKKLRGFPKNSCVGDSMEPNRAH